MSLRHSRLTITSSGNLKKRVVFWMMVFALLSSMTANARANTPVTAIFAGGAALLAHDALFRPAQSHRGRIRADVGEFDVIQQKAPAFETRVVYEWGDPLYGALSRLSGWGLPPIGAQWRTAGCVTPNRSLATGSQALTWVLRFTAVVRARGWAVPAWIEAG